MTAFNTTTLKTFFETGDVPSGTDYANFIDSYVNIVNTGLQTIASPLQASELIASRVSAGNLNVTGNMTAQTFSVQGIVSAASINTGALEITGQTSAVDVNISGEFIRPVIGYLAAGTAQATATVVSAGNALLTGASDGQATGYRLMANKTGLVQFVYNQNAVSANLWPCTGGQINALSSNAAFGMTASTLYTVYHTKASGYAVK